ncbi:Uncharacterized conserved protein [Halogranum amylolyticum]|uniref:Uncharacterized conserved protein n=1 Tax=Halogranum amylolyticum TaxID=660520 RepID=A0A1H8N6S5_9EURY|nr:saccharopine dehydrogenase NADP-binding domain-containing protein [Halogranum amylolyticum]SEO25179.1 Uncharacterized conserved protein [Halogranum amylolyticum]
MSEVLIYGSYGYTGDRIAREAVDRGWNPILAGRTAEKVTAQTDELGCRARIFDVDDAADRLRDVDLVLNCAGPFSQTAAPLAQACLETETHYLDITGEIGVFTRLNGMDEAAADADVTLMPGVGFDVVPTDCLAAHLHERLPSATTLSLGFDAVGSFSPGTLKTAVEGLGQGCVVRREGHLKQVPAAWKTRSVDFGRGTKKATTVPWGDVATAYYTTEIPNVEVYAALPRVARTLLKAERSVGGILEGDRVQSTLKWLVDRTVEGPDDEELEEGFVWVWGEAVDGYDSAVSRLRTPHTYKLTVETALLASERVLDGDAPVGYQTPGGAFGADFVLDVEGVRRVDD